MPVEITVENRTGVPVLLERAEALIGRRRNLGAFRETVERSIEAGGKTRRFLRYRAVIPKDGTFSFTVPMRCLEAGEDLLFSAAPFYPQDLDGKVYAPDGEGGLRRLEAEELASATEIWFPIDVSRPTARLVRVGAPFSGQGETPRRPFDPPASAEGGWSYSPALGGYVSHRGGGHIELVTKTGTSALPAVPFEFLDDVETDGAADVLLESGEVHAVSADELPGFLDRLAEEKRTVGPSEEPDKAPWQIQR